MHFQRHRLSRAFAALTVASVLVAACGDDDDGGNAGGDTTGAVASDTTEAIDTETSGGGDTTAPDDTAAPGDLPAEGGTFNYAYEQEYSSYNNNHADANASKNQVVLNQILPDVFNFDPTGELVLDTTLMESAEVTSESPQIVTYVVKQEAVWSDGDPIDCDDFVLAWVADNGFFKQKNPDGSVVTDEAGNELPLFAAAGTTGYEQIESVDCSDDGKTITTTYSSPFADWKGLFSLGAILPAHIVEEQAGVPDIVAAVEAADETALASAAEFWNHEWVLDPGDLKPELTPSGDAYILDSWEAGSSLTMVRNPSFWGPPATSESIVIRYIAQDAQAQALANGEVHALDPQPNPELKAQLDGMSGVEVWTGEQYTLEYFHFNFAKENIAIPEVREAFAKCVPRQLIVDNLIKPQNPEAFVQNHHINYPFESRYKDNSGGEYDEVDLEGARSLLQSVGLEGMTLQINSNGNPRRLNEIALVQDSCDQAGFLIEDISEGATFFDADGGLNTGNFDVALFAFAGSPLATSSSSSYITNGGNNNGKYSNPEVDARLTELNQTLDEDRQNELIDEVDVLLWEDLESLPLFCFPAIEAHAEFVEGVEFNPTQQQLTWNAQEWLVIE